MLKPDQGRETYRVQDIASEFALYPFKEIVMSGFLLSELMLLAKANSTDSILPILKAVDNVIDVDVNILTIPDFFYMMYWLRIESFPKTPLYLPWTCDQKTEKGEVCGYKNLDRLMHTNMRTKYLKECKDHDKPLPPGIAHPRALLLESLDLKDRNDPAYEIYKVAMWVEEGRTIDDKVTVLMDQTTPTLYEDALHTAIRLKYGVEELANVNCKECGASRLYQLSISAATFLPKT